MVLIDSVFCVKKSVNDVIMTYQIELKDTDCFLRWDVHIYREVNKQM